MMFDNKYTLDKIIDNALYMRFDRIIVGEIHDKGLFYLLKAMRTGGDGSISTFHAGSSKEVFDMVKNHLIIEHAGFDSTTAANYIRGALDLIVVLEHQGKQHRILEITEVGWEQSAGGVADQAMLNSLYEFEREKGLKGKHVCTGFLPDNSRIRRKLQRAGVDINPEWFASAGDK